LSPARHHHHARSVAEEGDNRCDHGRGEEENVAVIAISRSRPIAVAAEQLPRFGTEGRESDESKDQGEHADELIHEGRVTGTRSDDSKTSRSENGDEHTKHGDPINEVNITAKSCGGVCVERVRCVVWVNDDLNGLAESDS